MSAPAELLQWHAVSERLPDDDTTVLLWFADGEWFTGWHEDGGWLAAESGGSVVGVTHWAEPTGPTA